MRTAPETKFDPVTVSANAALPASALLGASALTTGGANVTVKVAVVLGLWRVGSETDTCAVPAVCSSRAGIDAESCDCEMKVVASAVCVPFALNCTCDFELKPLPPTDIDVTPVPTATDSGDIALN